MYWQRSLHRMLDTATSLAEEFLEFPLLVRICEENNQQSKLFHYMDTFSKENFSEFVFQVRLYAENHRLIILKISFNPLLTLDYI